MGICVVAAMNKCLLYLSTVIPCMYRATNATNFMPVIQMVRKEFNFIPNIIWDFN